MQIHGPSAVVTSVAIDTFGGPGAVALRFPGTISLVLFSAADCDELIKAAVVAKDVLLSGQQPYELPALSLATADGAQ